MDYEESFRLYNKARELVAMGQFEMAIPLLKKSSSLYPHHKTFELWGECEIKLGNYSQSIEALMAAIGLNRGIKPKSLLALAYANVGRKAQAVELATEILKTAPNNKIAISVLGSYK